MDCRTPMWKVEASLGFNFKKGLSRDSQAKNFPKTLELLNGIDRINQTFESLGWNENRNSEELRRSAEDLFDEVGPFLWPDFDQVKGPFPDWLLRPDQPDPKNEHLVKFYPRHLFFTSEFDRSTLAKHFYALICLKAFRYHENHFSRQRSQYRPQTFETYYVSEQNAGENDSNGEYHPPMSARSKSKRKASNGNNGSANSKRSRDLSKHICRDKDATQLQNSQQHDSIPVWQALMPEIPDRHSVGQHVTDGDIPGGGVNFAGRLNSSGQSTSQSALHHLHEDANTGHFLKHFSQSTDGGRTVVHAEEDNHQEPDVARSSEDVHGSSEAGGQHAFPEDTRKSPRFSNSLYSDAPDDLAKTSGQPYAPHQLEASKTAAESGRPTATNEVLSNITLSLYLDESAATDDPLGCLTLTNLESKEKLFEEVQENLQEELDTDATIYMIRVRRVDGEVFPGPNISSMPIKRGGKQDLWNTLVRWILERGSGDGCLRGYAKVKKGAGNK